MMNWFKIDDDLWSELWFNDEDDDWPEFWLVMVGLCFLVCLLYMLGKIFG